MTTSDKSLFYGFWGVVIGFALYFGWRIAIPLLAPLASYVFGLFVTDTSFNPILASALLNLGLDLVAGLVVSFILAFFIWFALKPTTMLFLLVPVATLLGKSYWLLISSYVENSLFSSNTQLVLYVGGPLLVALSFVVAFRVVGLKSLPTHKT